MYEFYAKKRNCVYGTAFPRFRLGVSDLQFVPQFKYLGHYITHNLSDDNDIHREISSMFVCCNILIRKFCKCSLRVKLKLFQSRTAFVFMPLHCCHTASRSFVRSLRVGVQPTVECASVMPYDKIWYLVTDVATSLGDGGVLVRSVQPRGKTLKWF